MRKMKCAGYAREDSWKGGITVPATSVQLSDISEYVGRHTEMELTAVYSDRAGSEEFYNWKAGLNVSLSGPFILRRRHSRRSHGRLRRFYMRRGFIFWW